jgi:hypothetical protein
MAKYNLSEAAKEILDASVASKRGGQDKPARLHTDVAYGTKEVGMVGQSPEKETDENPNYTSGVPSATPPGATPPVGSEPMHKLSGQPQETQGRSDLKVAQQSDATDYDSIRDRKPAKLAQQMMSANPGATFQSYHEEAESDDEVIDEAHDEKHEKHNERKEKMHMKMKQKMKEDIAALVSGENLSEEFVQKATTIFEAAVIARAEEVIAEAEQQLVEEFELAVEEIKQELSGKLDDYLNYMVEEWMSENELAIESGLRAEVVEEFIYKLRNLFVESYIDIPEERVNVVEELVAKVEELEETLNEEIKKNVQFAKTLVEHKKIEAIREACEGLTQTQAEKLKALAESVDYTDPEEFESAVATLKESYFPAQVKVADSDQLNEEIQIEEEAPKSKAADPDMNVYAQAISKTLAK